MGVRAFFVLLALGWAQCALAYSPYLADKTSVHLDNGGSVTLALWYGDGILGPDPVRVVVFDEVGSLLAVGPLATSLTLRCQRPALSECRVYDHDARLIYTFFPQPPFGKIEWTDAGAPGQCPSSYGEEFGFEALPVGSLTAMSWEVLSLVQNPIATVIVLCWWACMWLLVLPRFRKPTQLRIYHALFWAMRLAAAAGMLYLTVIMLMFSTANGLYLTLVIALGLGVALGLRGLWSAIRGGGAPQG
ncbi:hypothetical protein ACS3SW_15255 [Roseobacteraceae bacterium S113]